MEEEISAHLLSTRCCGSCNKSLEHLNSITTISGNESNSDVSDDLLVYHAVAYMYRISSKDLQNILENYANDQSNYNDLSSVVLCYSCGLLLQDSYRSWKRFESTICSSSFFEQVQKFRDGNCQSRNEKQLKSVVNYEKRYDIDHLFDDFNFDSSEEPEEPVKPEEKHPVSDSKLILHNAKISKCRKRQSKTLSKDVFVKLEKLSDKDLRRHCGSKKYSRKIKKPVRNSNKKGRKLIRKRNDIANNMSNLKESSDTKPEEEKGPFKCDQCEKTFASRVYIKRIHMQRAHSETSSLGTTCEVCGKLLKNRGSLAGHMKKKHPEKLGLQKVRVPCKYCDKLLFEDTVKAHMERKHSGPRPTFKCEECDKVFAYKVTYDDHIVIHRKDFTPFKCSYCDKTFHKKAVLKIHETIHTAEKKFECQECGRKFLNLFNLKKHIESHSTEKKHVCEECGKSFKGKQYLVTHLKIHKEVAEKGENWVKCPDCGRTYKHTLALSKHRTRTHGDPSKKTIYKCSFCAKILSSSTNLKRHENIHKTKT